MIFEIIYLIFLVIMIIQAGVNIYLSLYVWENPDNLKETASPKKFLEPQISFSVLLPARFEQKVIGQTIQRIASVNYPKNLIEILIVCEEKDIETIQKAKNTIHSLNIINARVLTFNNEPINKPHGLNIGLNEAKNKIIVVFDAEDDISHDIFNVANTLFIMKKPDIIQAGVQLMNYNSHWFSVHNVLEYYFWFKSRMHLHAKIGMVLLSGNTVFFHTKQLREIGGWNENCLTEDAEIGIRLSIKGAHIISTYDSINVTKEETPNSVKQFIKQRTRWNQGFIQVLRLGYWGKYNTLFKRTFCFYSLSFPIFQAILFIITPFVLIYGLSNKLPVFISLLSIIPVLMIVLQYVISFIALNEFIDEQKLHNNKLIFIYMLLTLLPYQFLLSAGAFRALYRELLGMNNWEKTSHTGIHRNVDNLWNREVDVDK